MAGDRSPNGEWTVSPETDRLLVDVMLGKLLVYLRICGYDAATVADRDVGNDEAIREVAHGEGRTLLSRDVSLVAGSPDAVLLNEHDIRDQLAALRTAGFELTIADPPTRCGRCNGVLEPVPAGTTRPAYAPSPAEFDCWRCTDCGQFFWKGSHWDRVNETL